MTIIQERMKIGATYHIFLAYFLGLGFRESPSKILPEIWYIAVPTHLLDPEMSIESRELMAFQRDFHDIFGHKSGVLDFTSVTYHTLH